MFTPKYNITNAILRNIGRVESAKAIIENAPLVPSYEKKFREQAIIRTVHHGTHIEGNALEAGEVEKVLDGKEISARDRDVQEVLNYRDVLRYIDVNRDNPITEKTLLEIHKLTTKKILKDEAVGTYRSVQVKVSDSKTGEISYMPPPAGQISDLARDFFFWLVRTDSDEVHPVVKSAITHYVLTAIHPFVDGNGRASRALSTLVLFKDGYDIKSFFSIEEYFDRDSASYYRVLQQASNQSKDIKERDLTGWVEYFTSGLAVELDRVREKVQKLSVDIKLKGKLGQIPLNDRQLKLVEYMQENGQINNEAWRGLIPMVSDDTILRDLKYLMKKGLVRKRGSTKASVYVLK